MRLRASSSAWTHRRAVIDQGTSDKIHSSLRVSPAMAAGVRSRLFDVADLVTLLIESESKQAA
jgi:hypothetical protein